MEDTPGIKERPAEGRIREAAALAGVSTLVVACPKDIAMFRDALKTTGLEGKLAVRELAELAAEAGFSLTIGFVGGCSFCGPVGIMGCRFLQAKPDKETTPKAAPILRKLRLSTPGAYNAPV